MVRMRQRNLIVLEFQKGGSDNDLMKFIHSNIEFMRNHCLAFHEPISSELENLLKQSGIDHFLVRNEKIFLHKRSTDSKNNPPQPKTQPNNAKKITITIDTNSQKPIITESPITQDPIEYGKYTTISAITGNTQILESTLTQKKDSPLDTTEKHPVSMMDSVYGNNVLHSKTLPTLTFRRKIRSGEELNLESNVILLRDIAPGALLKARGNVHMYAKCDGILESFGDYIVMQDIFAGRIYLKGMIVDVELLSSVRDSNRLKMITIENDILKIIEI